MRVEQDVQLVLKNLTLKKLGQPYDEILLTDQTNDSSTTKRMEIVLSSKMNCYSEKTKERMVISNTKKS